jgi:hypothetical protein
MEITDSKAHRGKILIVTNDLNQKTVGHSHTFVKLEPYSAQYLYVNWFT